MNHSDSLVCLLDKDVLQHVVHSNQEIDVHAESSSSGYESSDVSDDETAKPCFTFNSARHPTSTRIKPHSRCFASTRPPTHGDVMILRNTGDFQDSLSLILDMPDMCDVTFVVGRNQVPIHGVKAILATRSRYLYQMILQEQKRVVLGPKPSKKTSKKSKSATTKNKLSINVPDYHVEDFRAFLGFVHSGKTEIRSNNVIGLLCAAVEFGFPDLQSTCMKFLEILQDKGHTSVLLDSAWAYQHKRTGQKMICQCNQLKLTTLDEVSVRSHPRDPVDDWSSRSRSSNSEDEETTSEEYQCTTLKKQHQWFPLTQSVHNMNPISKAWLHR